MRCGCLVVLLPVLLILGYLVFCLVYAVVDNKIGLTGHTVHLQWHESMRNGDGQAAIYWAQKNIIYQENRMQYSAWKNANYKSLPEDYGMTDQYNDSVPAIAPDRDAGFRLSLAYELSGEYDLALKRYKMSEENPQRYTMPGFGDHPLHIARVLYKMGRHSESFEQYGKYCKNEMERRDMPKDYRRFEIFYDGIMCHDMIDDSRKFRPFATFHDFYEFMEKECERQGGPGQYAKVMELFRDIDSSAESHMARHNE